MTMKLSNEFNEIRQKFVNAVADQAPQEEQNKLYNDMLEAMFEEAKKVASNEVQTAIAMSPAEAKMTARERKFFNEIDKTIATGAVELLPEETVDDIFENMVTEHPLLQAVGIRNAGLRLKFLDAETSGVVVWGHVFGEIKGKLQAAFNSDKAIQNKATAFIVIPKDAVKYGPAWIKQFIMLQFQEAFSVALEAVFLNGNGAEQPVGLAMQLTGTTSPEGITTYPAKAATGALTFADSKTIIKEIAGIHKHHSVDSKKNPVATKGRLVMVINPSDIWDLVAEFTVQNSQGTYITSMPFNMELVESVAQVAGKVTTFIKGRYNAVVAGGVEIQRYTETLALEDMDLYTAKQFAYGKAKDEKAAAVWTLPATTPGV